MTPGRRGNCIPYPLRPGTLAAKYTNGLRRVLFLEKRELLYKIIIIYVFVFSYQSILLVLAHLPSLDRVTIILPLHQLSNHFLLLTILNTKVSITLLYNESEMTQMCDMIISGGLPKAPFRLIPKEFSTA